MSPLLPCSAPSLVCPNSALNALSRGRPSQARNIVGFKGLPGERIVLELPSTPQINSAVYQSYAARRRGPPAFPASPSPTRLILLTYTSAT